MRRKKDFDAVQMMREIRDRMSMDMKGMSYEEQVEYIERGAKVIRSDLALDGKRKAA